MPRFMELMAPDFNTCVANCLRWWWWGGGYCGCGAQFKFTQTQENICSCPQSHVARLLLLLVERFHGCQSIHENCKAFQPQTIRYIWQLTSQIKDIVLMCYISCNFQTMHAELATTSHSFQQILLCFNIQMLHCLAD